MKTLYEDADRLVMLNPQGEIVVQNQRRPNAMIKVINKGDTMYVTSHTDNGTKMMVGVMLDIPALVIY